jgi:hypothetical protein
LVRSLTEGQAAKRENQRAGLAERHEKQLNAQKRQGRETRAKIIHEVAQLVAYPRREWAKLIARKCSLPERTVRYHLRSIRNID